jgi:outer membrane protein OmpA-like peptidoglycan-associated protein
MRGRTTMVLGLFAVSLCVAVTVPSVVRADGPVIGANVGAAIPLGDYKRTIAKDLGGTTGFWGGYRFNLTDDLSLSLLAQPQFMFFATEHRSDRANNRGNDDDVSTLFSITGGPELSVKGGIIESYVGAQGGYYRDLSGPLDDDGIGFNVNGGIRFEVVRDTTVGVFGRYDRAYISAARASNDDRQFLLAGFTFQRVFQPPPPPPRAEVPPPPPPPPPVRRKIVLRGVHFDFNKWNIRPDARPVLDEAIHVLGEERDINISVEGHTDAIGSDAYNQRLSERRAQSVADYLEHGGVARRRMRSGGNGESRPVAPNDTDEGRAQNRRVELHVLGE